MAANGHNGKTNGHAFPVLALGSDPGDRAAFDAAVEILAAELAAPRPPAGLVACDACQTMTQYRDGRTDCYKVHFAAPRDIKPCPRSWPPPLKPKQAATK